MSDDKFFVDTNVLVYAHDRTSGAKYEKARSLTRELWDSDGGVISTQVLQELYSAFRRKSSFSLSQLDAEEILRDYFEWEVVVNTRNSILRAIEIETRYKISFWDGLILQAAEVAAAHVLYTEDLSHGQTYAGVRAINPFRE
jgi:predicted nucleic acid-binding protein